MKLRHFYIENYRVLRDLRINFSRGKTTTSRTPDPQRGYALDFLAGVNGTGKTTILYLLGTLFAQLMTQDYYFPTPVELSYTLKTEDGREQQILISNLPNEDGEEASEVQRLQYRIGDGDWTAEKMRSENLPNYIVIYTTGSEAEWLQVLSTDEEEDDTAVAEALSELDAEALRLREQPGHRFVLEDDEMVSDFNVVSRLLFIHSDRLPLVSLCGLIASRYHQEEPKHEILHPVLSSIGLDAMTGFSLRLRSDSALTPPAQQQIVDRLEGIADQTIHQGADRLLVFSMDLQVQRWDEEDQKSIFDIYDSPIELFKRLNHLYKHRPHYDPPLQEVNIFLRRSTREIDSQSGDKAEDQPPYETPMLHLFEWLSDGERSFLGRMALFALFRADNLLILLDEPEVHFNDVWKREIVNMLDQIMRDCASHAVITTHSSIALSDVRKEDIVVLRRQEQLTQGAEAVREPDIETFGADPSDILVHVFGTRSASGERSVRFIREEIGRGHTVEQLEALEEVVAPGYWRYRIQLETERLQQAAS